MALPALIFITDMNRVPDPDRIISCLGPKDAVIFRDYTHPEREALGRRIAAAVRRGSTRFLVAGDGRLAEKLEADGLHMPEGRQAEILYWRKHHPDWLIMAAAHSKAALERASAANADAALLSPVFPTASHPETIEGTVDVLGAEGFARLADESPLPVYALGGITTGNAGLVRGRYAVGMAAIGAFLEK